jgi:putrescine transport system substrate-binding protein
MGRSPLQAPDDSCAQVSKHFGSRLRCLFQRRHMRRGERLASMLVNSSNTPSSEVRMKTVLVMILVLGLTSCGLLVSAIAQEKVVNVYGWGDYIDPKVIEDFTKETGIKVTYDAYDSNEVIEGQALGGKTRFDVVIVPGRHLQRLIAAGQLQRLDKTKLPNSRNLWPEVMARLGVYDPGNQYAVNYLWFTMGLAYNVGKIKEVLGDAAADAWRGPSNESRISWDVIFRPESQRKFASCGVMLPDSGEDMFAIALIYFKADPASMRPTLLKYAADLLSIAKRKANFDSSGIADALVNGDICLALGQSFESFRARDRAREADSEVEIDFAIPKEGSLMLLDNLAIPTDAHHVEEAYAFIDFLLRPEVAARNTNFTHLASGVLVPKPAIDARLAENASLYPDESVMHRLFAAPYRDPASQKAIDREWARIKSGKYLP